ncbi:MAG TPA: hypothetical protein VG796_00055 [Verrucomicrobiales bacterium]|nr:hypothetical protein [Verrucomicrobiales bacterium]
MGTPFEIIGLVSLVTSAVGAGVQYAASSAAADTEAQLALLNAQAQTQAIEQRGQVNQMQAAINEQLARREAEAANANAANLAAEAEAGSSRSREATRLSREQAARFAASQRAAMAKAGFTDTTGSPLLLLADTAQKAQRIADNARMEDEESRRQLFREAALQKNQAILAGLNAQGQQLNSLAAAQAATSQAAQARLDLYSQRAAASAARTQAAGTLFDSFGGIAGDAFTFFRNKPGTPGKVP